MADEKVVTVTLPGGTRVTCREGLAARLGVKRVEPSEAQPVVERPARPRRSPRTKPQSTEG